jgi:hypothetical protein
MLRVFLNSVNELDRTAWRRSIAKADDLLGREVILGRFQRKVCDIGT